MLVRHPSGQGAGVIYDGLVYNLDLTSTLLSLIGFEPWKALDGTDLWPKVLAGERPEVCAELLSVAVADAGGTVPDDFAQCHDKPGCTPFEDRSGAHGALFKAE